MIEPQANAIRSSVGTSVLLFAFMLVTLFFTLIILVSEAQAQVRRPGRLQKKIEKVEQRQEPRKLNPSGSLSKKTMPESATATTLDEQPELAAPKNGAQAGRHSLDGARDRGLISIFRPEERNLVIPGFGTPATLMVVFRQLDLTDQQKQDIKAIRNRVGNRLAILQRERRELDLQLTEAIYGENFDPKRVEELASQVAERQSEITKLLASIESQLRQAMTPDQFFVFQMLISQMVPMQRRIPLDQLRQMMQRRMGAPNRPNQQNIP